MSEIIHISKLNESYLKVSSPDRGIEQDLCDYFCFQAPGYKFMPAFRNGSWDGKIRLYNLRDRTIYAGLLDQLKTFAEYRGYQIECDSTIDPPTEFGIGDFVKFLKTANLSDSIVPRDYQINTLIEGIRHSRMTFLSPTASGKSLMIYLLTQYYQKKTLIIVPNINLVHQLASNFEEYGYTGELHKICEGSARTSDAPIVISTWQSLFRLPREYFDQYEVIIGDEVHGFKATSLISIMTKATKAKYRFGFTGTLDESITNERTIHGLFGPVMKVTTTKDLIDSNTLSAFSVKCIAMNYSDDEKKYVKTLRYDEEIDFIVQHSRRNKFICKLATQVKGNTLVLFQYVEKHGEVLYDMIKKSTDRPVFFVSGKVDGDKREAIRKAIETHSDAIIVASVGVFSTGINIVSLKNIIFASPSKSRIRVLQSIGRVLRRSETKQEAVLFDIADDLRWKKKMNYTYSHFAHRLKIYAEESFPYKIHNVKV